MLAVDERPLAIRGALLEIEDRASGLDNRDARAGTQVGQLAGKHGGADAAADDADVTLVNGHGGFSLFASHFSLLSSRSRQASGAGRRVVSSIGRHTWRPIFAWYAMSLASLLRK